MAITLFPDGRILHNGTDVYRNNLVKLAATTVSSTTASVIFNTSTSGFLDGTYKTHLVKFTGVQIDTDNRYPVMSVYESGVEKTNTEYQGDRERDSNNRYNGSARFVFSVNTVGNNTSGSIVYEDYSGHVYLQNYEANRRFSIYGQMVYMNTSSEATVSYTHLTLPTILLV